MESLWAASLRFQQNAGEVAKSVLWHELPAVEIEDVCHVGEVQPMMQQRSVRDLRGETRIDQRLGWSEFRGSSSPLMLVGHVQSFRMTASSAVAVPPVCQKTTGPSKPSALSWMSAARAFAV